MSASCTAPKVSKKRPVPQWKEALAGAVAGAFSKTALAPVERIKLLKQLQGSVKLAPQSSKQTSPSAWQVTANVYRQEGLVAFWRGNWPNVWRTAGTAAINFTCMDYYKKVAVAPFLDALVVQRKTLGGRMSSTLSQHDQQQIRRRRQFISSLVSGGLAGASSTTLLYPFDFLRTRLAMDVGGASQRQFHGMQQVVRRILHTDGIRGFFQGFGIALTGGIVYRVLFLGGYDAVKDEGLYRKQQQPLLFGTTTSPPATIQLSWTERMAIAQAISLSAGTICYPFDSVRRRMMMQAGQAAADRSYRNSIDCMRQVLRQEGVRGFYLGIGPNLVRSVSGALLLVGYDVVRSFLRY